ncbi:MAG: AraC family transcriptional regulator [Lentisphaerota bacterium]
MSQTTIPDLFRSPAIGGKLLAWSPYLRLAHDFRIQPMYQRVYNKELIGDHALHYFLTGAGEYDLDGRTYTITPRTVFLVRPGHGYHFRLAEGAVVRMLNLHFDLHETAVSQCLFPCPSDDAKFKEVLPADLATYQQLNNFTAYEQTFFQLLDAAGRQGISAFLQRKGLLLEIISLLYANPSSIQKPVTLLNHQQAIDKAMKYIHANPEAHPTLDELAGAAGVCRALFCRIFRQNTGMTPQKYLNRHRVELATSELLYSDTPVKDIAVRCGFADVHHFSRIFKNITGISPASFRSSHNLYE